MRLITVFGAGLLLGAALAIVIPEGVDALYSASNIHFHSNLEPVKSNDEAPSIRRKREAVLGVEAAAPDLPKENQQQQKSPRNDMGAHQESNHTWFSFAGIHQQVGIALLVGYLFMLAIDQFSSSFLEWLCCQKFLPLFCCGCLRRNRPTPSGSTNNGNTNSTGDPYLAEPKRITVTFGLVIHSLADGLAVGSAFALGQLQLEIILFLAIILHKAPAAFGLACFLLHEGFTRDQIRCHLLTFASAAPVAAFLTYFYLILPSSSESDQVTSGTKTGIALLLSGGTFLYVAASHILPELIYSRRLDNRAGQTSTINSESRQSSDYTVYSVGTQAPIMTHPSESGHFLSSSPKLSAAELLILSVGAIIPLILSSTHSH